MVSVRRSATLLAFVSLAAVSRPVGLKSVAPADIPLPDPFCSSQMGLVSQYLGPLVKPLSGPTGTAPQAVGMVVITLKLENAPCLFTAGESVLGSGVAPDGNTIFELASVTKIFTTAILALRQQQQSLDVTAPVAPHLTSEFALQPEEAGVTFQQLATFTGGFHWSDPPDFVWTVPYTQHEFVKHVNHVVPRHTIRGETYLPTRDHYSNGSIGLLGQALMNMDSTVGQQYPPHAKGYSKWIFDNLTGPLNMPNTAVEPDCCAWAQGNKQTNSGAYAPLGDFPWVPWGAAGALRSNAYDMLNFLDANICAHHRHNTACAGLPSDILDALALAHAPNNYTPSGTLADPTIFISKSGGTEQGWAWRYQPPPDPNPSNLTTVISKDGGHPGFTSYIGFAPDKSYGLVILMNTGGVAAKGAGLQIIRHTN